MKNKKKNYNEEIREYKKAVIADLCRNYLLSEKVAKMIVEKSYLDRSFKVYPEEQLHVDIQNTVEEIYANYTQSIK